MLRLASETKGAKFSPHNLSYPNGTENAFKARQFTPVAVNPDEIIFRGKPSANFAPTASALLEFEKHFALKTLNLARAHHAKLVFVQPPFLNQGNTQIAVRSDLPELYGSELAFIGIPDTILFKGLNQSDLDEMFYDSQHLNANGSTWFTKSIAPAVLKLFREQMAPTESTING